MEPRGDISGETAVRVQFPVPGKRLPVRFGIPLGQVPSARKLAESAAGSAKPGWRPAGLRLVSAGAARLGVLGRAGTHRG